MYTIYMRPTYSNNSQWKLHGSCASSDNQRMQNYERAGPPPLSSLLEVELHDGETEQEREETGQGNVHQRDEPQEVVVEAIVFCDELCHGLWFI